MSDVDCDCGDCGGDCDCCDCDDCNICEDCCGCGNGNEECCLCCKDLFSWFCDCSDAPGCMLYDCLMSFFGKMSDDDCSCVGCDCEDCDCAECCNKDQCGDACCDSDFIEMCCDYIWDKLCCGNDNNDCCRSSREKKKENYEVTSEISLDDVQLEEPIVGQPKLGLNSVNFSEKKCEL